MRLPEGEFASDAWDLVASFDSGHLVFSQAVVTNLGWGDHKAAVVGIVVTPDEKVQVFRRSEAQGPTGVLLRRKATATRSASGSSKR